MSITPRVRQASVPSRRAGVKPEANGGERRRTEAEGGEQRRKEANLMIYRRHDYRTIEPHDYRTIEPSWP